MIYRYCHWEYNTGGVCQSNIPIHICHITFIHPFCCISLSWKATMCGLWASVSKRAPAPVPLLLPRALGYGKSAILHELLAAVVLSQLPRNTSEHLCVIQTLKVLLSQEVKISSMLFVSALTLVLLHVPGFMPFLLVPSKPSSLLTIN